MIKIENNLYLQNFKEKIDGLWVVKSVNHTLDRSGLRTRITANLKQ